MTKNPEVTYGETSQFRFMPLPGPTEVRPANFDAQALSLPELTTSDMPVTISTKSDAAPKMYGSPAAGTEVTYAKPRPDQGSWTVSLSGNVQPTADERAAMVALFAQAGKYVWIERRTHLDDRNEGGCAIVTATGKPVPADGIVTFTATLTGYGRKFDDTGLAIP